MGLVLEMRRRNVFRMAALYLVAAWLIMQVAGVLIDLAKLPHWIGTTTLWLLAVGFPIALFFSWLYEITPAGISLERDIEPGESITHVTGRRLDFLVISLLCAAVILFAYDKWWMPGPAQQSIAVMPFENMSDDPGNEYFSDGISEEILNLLSQVPELIVISRSSAFSFKGQNLDLPTIADRLNVAHILEGSVRWSGDQLRITAQLIEVETDRHLWSKSFDRELEDVFAIQDEIAAEVVDALKVSLLGGKIESAETDPEVYAAYLQARHLKNFLTEETHKQAEKLLQQALAIDPGFAPAWAELSVVYWRQAAFFSNRDRDEGFELSRDAAQRSLALDPQYGPAYAALAYIEARYDFDFKATYQHIQKALALDQGNAEILLYAGWLEGVFGRLDEAIELTRKSIARDPVDPLKHDRLGILLFRAHRLDEAEESFQMTLSLSPVRSDGLPGAHDGFLRGLMLLARENAPAALVAMNQEAGGGFRLAGMAIANHALADVGASDAALQELIKTHEMSPRGAVGWAYQIAQVYAYRGEIDHAFDWLERAYDSRDDGLLQTLTDPLLVNVHEDPRWDAFLDKMGLPH